MALIQSDGSTELIPAGRREIYDITGAGDMALAALGLSIAARAELRQAVRLANLASGLQVEKLGVAPVTRAELQREIENQFGNQQGQRRRIPQPSKVTTVPDLVQLAQAYRQSGKTIVFTNGCFDLLHVGHVTMLKEAAALGDVLIVAVNNDASVRQLKGPDRPLINEDDRAELLASLACVDHVLIFGEPTPHGLLEQMRPDILAKGGTTSEIIGREVVEAYGGRAVRLPEIPGASTTAIVSRFDRDPAPREPQGNAPLFETAVLGLDPVCEGRVLKDI
jgi:D-beta-D-heptose 7-phosphate kinase/D-beta-D-heptose 1-phosphate adenosyltransferase